MEGRRDGGEGGREGSERGRGRDILMMNFSEQTSLTKAEEELLEAQIAVGHYDHFKEKLERIGAAWTDMKEKKFADRVQAEAKLVENARRKEATRERLCSLL